MNYEAVAELASKCFSEALENFKKELSKLVPQTSPKDPQNSESEKPIPTKRKPSPQEQTLQKTQKASEESEEETYNPTPIKSGVSEEEEQASESEENSMFDTEEEDQEEVLEPPEPQSLPRNSESLSKLLSSLQDEKSSEKTLKALESMFEDNFDSECFQIISSTKAPAKLKEWCKDKSPETKQMCNRMIKHWKAQSEKIYSATNDGEDWTRLKRRLEETMNKKADSEINGLLRRIGDSLPEKVNSQKLDLIKPVIKVVKDISKNWKNGEVKQRAEILLKRWTQKLGKDEDDSIQKQRQLMDEKLKKYKQDGKPIVQTEDQYKKPIHTVPAEKTIKNKKRRKP